VTAGEKDEDPTVCHRTNWSGDGTGTAVSMPRNLRIFALALADLNLDGKIDLVTGGLPMPTMASLP
jgi:hypothetical protein